MIAKKVTIPSPVRIKQPPFFWFPDVMVFIPYFQWIGLRENLQETIGFPIKYGVFL